MLGAAAAGRGSAAFLQPQHALQKPLINAVKSLFVVLVVRCTISTLDAP